MSHYAHPYAPPVAPPGSGTDPRVPLGVACLLLAVLEIGWFAYKLVAALVAGLLDYLQRTILPGAVPAPVSSAVGRVTEKARTLTGLEVASLVPSAGLALVLVGIAVGLLAKRDRGITWARAWCGVALFALLGVLAIQILAIAPQLLEVEQWINKHVAARGNASVVLPTMLWMIGHSVLLGIWPLVLWFWSGHVQKRARHPARWGMHERRAVV